MADRDNRSGPSKGNKFANDGSFLELFKKQMEAQNKYSRAKRADSTASDETQEEVKELVPSEKSDHSKTNVTSLVGKRRSGGAMVLKTGMVKKPKQEENTDTDKEDGWSKYMAEVNKYKSKMCMDEDKTRPLVK